jgi:uncharacterized protein YndB with AHSA1/START domain
MSTHVYQVFIKATQEQVWDAITQPEWSQRYGYQAINDYDLRPGGKYEGRATPQMQSMGMPELVVDGQVIEADRPHRLVHTWRFLWDDNVKAEGPTTITFDLKEAGNGVTKLTVTHVLENAPHTEAQITGSIEGAGGGWAYVLSDLKSVLETGKALEAGAF